MSYADLGYTPPNSILEEGLFLVRLVDRTTQLPIQPRQIDPIDLDGIWDPNIETDPAAGTITVVNLADQPAPGYSFTVHPQQSLLYSLAPGSITGEITGGRPTVRRPIELDPVMSLNLTAPNGGQVWRIGSTQTIRWNSTGLAGNVRIQISRDGGASWTTLYSSTRNDGAQPWRVTRPATTRARIQVCSVLYPTVCSPGSANFTIR